MAWLPLPIGVENFADLREHGYYFVDKTLFIKELLDKKGKVNLITRPRRFGKTLNMSVLRYFFESGTTDNSALFHGLKIMHAGDEYISHMGKYPVISLSLKSMKQQSFSLSYELLKKAIEAEYSRHWEKIEASHVLTDAKRERYIRIRDLQGTRSDYADSIRFLSECLYACTGQQSIILIDEYDVPLENAYFNGFYDEMVHLIRSIFESALKTNDNLAFAVVTGCLRISKESIFTGLNNMNILSIRSHPFSAYFGFTPEEVEKMLADYGILENMETVKKWYDGYRFGDTEVYNPWSVINYISSCSGNKRAFPQPYWSNTSSNSIVKYLIEQADMSVREEIENLIEGGTITKPVHEDVTYEDMHSTQDNLWNFLFFTGYLKKIQETQVNESTWMEMAIPNSEVRYVYKHAVLQWFEKKVNEKELTPLYESLLQGDCEKMARILSKNLMETISFYDYQESYYHGFLAGMLKNIGDFIVQSNREFGDGRPDLVVRSPSVRGKVILIEIKVARSYRDLAKKCNEALEQIREQKYEAPFQQEGYTDIACYGVAFYRKECMVKKCGCLCPGKEPD